ncbi:MAG TPA: hypothetical protein VK179_18755 [Bacteroidales bacterium]|nr:hypothetical protein [Bacteroidales bacterium]
MENNVTSKEFNPEAGLKVIYDMIQSAKARIGKNYFYYLFWGYLVAFTATLEYLLIAVFEYPKHYMVWPVLMMAGLIVTIAFYLGEKKTQKSRTFIGTAMEFLWLGWLICFAILVLFANLRHDYTLIIPVILAMYGLAIFVAGGMVSFRPMIVGGILAWMASVGSYFVDYPIQLIILAVLVIVSHIVPGHILKHQSQTESHV